MTMRSVMAEMFGKETGCSRGRGGSMHLFDASTRFYGGNAIVGGGLPVAAGLAFAEQRHGSDAVAVCCFGEGAVAEGEWHETMNLASLWNLPMVFACENNLYAMGTALARSEADVDLVAKAASYGMTAWSVDGMDVAAVWDATRRALVRCAAVAARPPGPALPVPRAFHVRPRAVSHSWRPQWKGRTRSRADTGGRRDTRCGRSTSLDVRRDGSTTRSPRQASRWNPSRSCTAGHPTTPRSRGQPMGGRP
jgi:hypothetical protein